MSEVNQENQDNKPKKRVRWYKCDVCGYTWRSYSKGQRIKCPNCYEKRTGKKLGGTAEQLAEARKNIKKQSQPSPAKDKDKKDLELPPIGAAAPEGKGKGEKPKEQPKKSGFLSFWDKELFK